MTHSIFRILDANLNRAREGLRTAEEFARLAVGDEPRARALKNLRHNLDVLFRAPVLRCALLAARDVAGDVGAGLTLPTQNARARTGQTLTPADIAAAACKRAQEALRNIEEFLPAAARTAVAERGNALPRPRAVAALRYALYDLERDLFCAPTRRAVLQGRTLCLLWSPTLFRIDAARALAACVRGAQDAKQPAALLLQLRVKDIDDGPLLKLARRTRRICEQLDLPLILNDRPQVALHAGCAGVHLGQSDLPPALAREILGPNAVIGLSTHSAAQIAAARREPVDYLGLGPMFATATKPELKPQGTALAKQTRAARKQCPLPVYAIGGITVQNLAQLKPFGITAAAVSGAVFANGTEASIRQAVRQLLNQLR